MLDLPEARLFERCGAGSSVCLVRMGHGFPARWYQGVGSAPAGAGRFAGFGWPRGAYCDPFGSEWPYYTMDEREKGRRGLI